jgi:hypothetical protein
MFRGAQRWQLLFFVVLGAALLGPATAHATPTFLSAIPISASGQIGFEPRVVVAPSGTVIAVWTRSDGTNLRIQSSNRTPNGDWQAAQDVSPAGVSASGPEIAVDSSGNALVVWTQSDGTNGRINSAFRPAGGAFAAPVFVSASGADATAPDVSIDNSGNALVVWQRTDGTNLRVQAAIRSPGAGGGYGSITTLSDPGQDAFDPKAAAGPSVDANGVVVWTRSDGSNLRVESARRRDVVGFPRPKGASPFRASLVPAYNPCTTPNRVHGPSLAFGSCNPPVQTSSVLTIGSPDANGVGANFTGSAKYTAIAGNSATETDEADVRIVLSLVDIRNKTTLTDYVGPVTLLSSLQITDNGNAPETPEPGTGQSITYSAQASCTSTVSTSIGSSCNLNTTADSIVPGTVVEGRRSVWEFGQVQVKDAGPDNTPGNGDDTVFLRQGVFVP